MQPRADITLTARHAQLHVRHIRLADGVVQGGAQHLPPAAHDALSGTVRTSHRDSSLPTPILRVGRESIP